MCILCVDIQKNLLKPREIARNFREMTFKDPDHWVEVLIEIEKQGLTEAVSKEIASLED